MKTRLLLGTELAFVLYIMVPASSQPVSFSQTRHRGAFTAGVKDKTLTRYGHIDAFIGRRASLKEGERSSLRWLSRLLKQHPAEDEYVVEWYVSAGKGKWWNVATTFNKGSLSFRVARSWDNPHLRLRDRSWSLIDERQIHAAAQKGQTLRAFDKYEKKP